MILKDLCNVDWGNTNLTKSSYVEDGEFLAVSATGCDGKIGHYEHEANVPVLSAIGAQCGKMFFPNAKFTAIKNTITLTPKDNVIGKYLYYLFTAIKLPVRGAGQPFISKGDIEKFEITFFPALATQQKIVEKLDAIFAEIDKAVAATEANIKNAEALFESYLTKVFEKNEDAKNYKLDDVVTRLTNGYVGATKNIYLDSGIPYLLARHVKNNVLKFDERTYISEEFNRKNKKSILKKDDVLLVQSGHIGHSAVVPIEHEGHNCHAMIVISTIKDILSGEFLSLYFQSNKMRNLFENMRTGSTIKHLNCGDVKLLMIPIPSIEIQNKIIGDAKTIEALVTSIKKNLTEKITQLNYLRESILRQAFNGELIKE